RSTTGSSALFSPPTTPRRPSNSGGLFAPLTKPSTTTSQTPASSRLHETCHNARRPEPKEGLAAPDAPGPLPSPSVLPVVTPENTDLSLSRNCRPCQPGEVKA